MRDRHIILVALVVQALCAFFFIGDIVSANIGLRSAPIAWHLREIIEIGAAFGLVLGFALGALALFRSRQRHQRAEEKLRAASGAFMAFVEDSFDNWMLTPAEREVALFSIKGFSTAEIAGLRGTSEGTVKAQTNAIYRKAGVSGRSQLLTQFIDGLMDDVLPSGPARSAEFDEKPRSVAAPRASGR